MQNEKEKEWQAANEEGAKEKAERREGYLSEFIVHFRQAEKRVAKGETKLQAREKKNVGARKEEKGESGEKERGYAYEKKANEGAAETLMGALVRYVSLSTAFDPFGEKADEERAAYEDLKEILTPELYPEYKKAGGKLAEEIVKAEDEEFRADFEAMVAYVVAAAAAEGKEPVKTLREFYRAYRYERERERVDAFCRRDTAFEEGKKTGFPTLDEVLDGGLYPGLYVIGAPSSAGKTSFCIQLCDQLAENGYKTLFFSLEMSEEELLSKSISRLTFLLDGPKKTYAKSERRLTGAKYRSKFGEEEWELISKAAGRYMQKIAANKQVTESAGEYGVDEITRDVKNYIEATGEKPVVFIDYLQILKPRSENMTDKQNTDRNVSALKRLCRDEGVVVVAISSFNRAGYHQAAGLESFKESGAIEYSADAVFSLQPQGVKTVAETDKKGQAENKETFNKVKRMDVRPMTLGVLKNRRGRTGDEIAFDYRCVFGEFEDRGLVASIAGDRKENVL